MKEYQNIHILFSRIYENTITIGVDEESGNHGMMRDYIHEVERYFDRKQDLKGLNYLLSIRRLEKDFIQRVDRRYQNLLGKKLMTCFTT